MTDNYNITVGRVMTNCYIVSDVNTRDAVVIDPGDDAEGILKLINSQGLRVKYIFLTHGHFDHVLAVDKVREATGAKCVIHEKDAALMTNPPRAVAFGAAPKPADILVRGGEEFEAGALRFKWMHTPGHTPGSCCVICGGAMRQNAIYTGDTLFEDDCGRCDLPGGDYPAMLDSLRALAALEGDYRVFPGHDVPTTLDRERRHNVNMREALGL